MEVSIKLISDETVKRLNALPESLRDIIVPKALREAGDEIHSAIVFNLSGLQDNVVRGASIRSRSPQAYPVNVVTGHLRRSEGRSNPNTRGLSATQIAFFNSAVYSAVIHDGLRGNTPRPFIEDGISAKQDEAEKSFARAMEENT